MERFYHLGFGRGDLGGAAPKVALLSGDPQRAARIAEQHLEGARELSSNRGLNSYLGQAGGAPLLSSTSGMGAPSLSIVVNELYQLGVRAILRVGTSGSIQPQVAVGSVVISSSALCRQGAANDIAPPEYPAVADPFVTVALARAARELGVPHHVGITASVDTFYEGQGRVGGAKPFLRRELRGMLEEYQQLNVLNFEMEAGTLFKMGSVYGFRAGCVCAVIAQRGAGEEVVLEQKDAAVEAAVQVAVQVAAQLACEGEA